MNKKNKTDKPVKPVNAYKVIDADRNIVLQLFKKSDTKDRLKYYISLGLWNDIGVDRDGDIILWKD